MNFNHAEQLVEKNIARIEKLNKNLSSLIKNITVNLDDTSSGDTSLATSKINVGVEHKLNSKKFGVSEEALFSYVFYHEFGHQLSPWIQTIQDNKPDLINQFFDSYNTNKNLTPHDFLGDKSLFNSPKLFKFHESLNSHIENYNISSETLVLLDNTSLKMENIYKEQFAECFSFYMLKKQFPNQFEKITNFVLSDRKINQSLYQKNEDNLMDKYYNPGFVHLVENASKEFIEQLNSKNISSFDDFIKTVTPLIEKHTFDEIKQSMESNKIMTFFPKDLLNEQSIQDKIKIIREINKPEINNSVKNRT